MKRLSILLVLCWAAGCSSSIETQQNTVPAPADTTLQTRKANFVTQTDTVTTQRSSEHGDTTSLNDEQRTGFTVQIGSFLETKNAQAKQSLARKRFGLPVVSKYNSVKRRYQIRIGFFGTEEEARAFRIKLLREYPHEYKDAWIVRLNN